LSWWESREDLRSAEEKKNAACKRTPLSGDRGDTGKGAKAHRETGERRYKMECRLVMVLSEFASTLCKRGMRKAANESSTKQGKIECRKKGGERRGMGNDTVVRCNPGERRRGRHGKASRNDVITKESRRRISHHD